MHRSTAVSIRPYRPGDESGFHAAAIESVRELQPWMPWCHPEFALADAREWVERQIALFAAKTEFEFVIVDESGRILGGCGLNQIDEANRRANLGYWVRSSATGRRVATDAVRALGRWARDETDLHRLELVIATGNAPSLRVAERAGAIRECVLRDRLLLHGRFHDAVIYVFLRGENLGEP
ncbi:MAG TPA: GNAT family N-acetyltransferase [Thermoanaerobaculia bacterium]|nr:GNAT family N-acetyltransferase [Thermoanaerobaculia bacterium]